MSPASRIRHTEWLVLELYYPQWGGKLMIGPLSLVEVMSLILPLTLHSDMRVGGIKRGFFPMKMRVILMKLKEPLLSCQRRHLAFAAIFYATHTWSRKAYCLAKGCFCPFKWLKQVPLNLVVYATES